jgi:hypothetical protein
MCSLLQAAGPLLCLHHVQKQLGFGCVLLAVQAVQALMLYPGAKPIQLNLTLHGKKVGNGSFGTTTKCSIAPSSHENRNWVWEQHTQQLQERRREQPAAAADITQMHFMFKVLHEPEFLQEGMLYQAGMSFTPNMRSACREVLALHSSHGPHVCKALGMVLIAVPAEPCSDVSGEVAADVAQQLATWGYENVHTLDKPAGLTFYHGGSAAPSE